MHYCFRSGLADTPGPAAGTLRTGLTSALVSVLVIGLLAGCIGTDENAEDVTGRGSGRGSGSPTNPATSHDSSTSGPEAQAGTPTRRSAKRPSHLTEEHPARHEECRGRRATVVGTSNADRLRGRPGREVFAAGGGDDVISHVGKDDVVCAGAGDDLVTSLATKWAQLAWVIDLGAGDDRVRLAESTDVYGGPGDDRIMVEKGPSTLVGGLGDDVLRVTSTAVGRGPNGYAVNTPCLGYGSAVRAVHVDLLSGRARGQGRDTVRGFRCVNGSKYGDVIRGSDLPDSIGGGAGPDFVTGRAGDDGASGGPGDDRIYLGDGVDYANGDGGRDRLYGQTGDDTLEGWTGSDYLEGGVGNDQVYGAIYCAIGGNSYDTGGKLDGAPDEVFGNGGADYLIGDKGNDRLDGGAGYDWAQPGVHDRRIDWVENVEDYVNGCLENITMAEPLVPSEVRDDHPW